MTNFAAIRYNFDNPDAGQSVTNLTETFRKGRWIVDETILDVEKFLSETERKATNVSRELYRQNPHLSETLAKFVKEVRRAKSAVVREAASTAA